MFLSNSCRQFTKDFVHNFFRFFYELAKFLEWCIEKMLLNLFCFVVCLQEWPLNLLSFAYALNDPYDSFLCGIWTEIFKLVFYFSFELWDFISDFIGNLSHFLKIIFWEKFLVEILMKMADSHKALALFMKVYTWAIFFCTNDSGLFAVNTVWFSRLCLRASDVNFRK